MTTIDLGYRPRQWQKDCHLQRKRFTVLALHRRAGKTEMAIAELVDKALRFTQELGLFFYVAPLLKQAKTVAWLRLKARVAPLVTAGLAEVNESELWVRLTTNGAMIRIYGADNEHAMRGVRLDGVVIDEVAQIKPEVWDEVIQPALADRKGWAVFIGTPNGVNLFSKLYFDAQTKPDWFAARYTVYDTDALDPEEVERMRLAQSEATFAREMLCDFSAAGESQLISLTDVEDASRRHLQRTDYEWAPRILGVDPARFGDDRSIIIRRQGRMVFPFEPHTKLDNMTLAALVVEEIRAWKPHAVFIDEGNGGGVIDRVRQLGHDCLGVHFGGKAGRPRYVNKRTEMWFEMRDWLQAGGVIPPDQALKGDLAAPTYTFTPATDVYALEPKGKIKQRLKYSPDAGDALALTFAFPVHVDPRAEQLAAYGINVDTGVDDPVNYDPYANL